jgi:hypothetical protein
MARTAPPPGARVTSNGFPASRSTETVGDAVVVGPKHDGKIAGKAEFDLVIDVGEHLVPPPRQSDLPALLALAGFLQCRAGAEHRASTQNYTQRH